MQDYIASCPEFIRKNVASSEELTAPFVKEYLEGGYESIWIIACGSSSNGSLCARQFIRRHLKCEVKIVTPFQFVASEHDFTDKDMLVVVSQSGYSLNALDAVKVIHQAGRRALGLTGDLNSDLAKECDVVANYGVGRETVGYVTRGVTTLALFFMLFAVDAAFKKGLKTAEEVQQMRQQFFIAADCNEKAYVSVEAFITKHFRGLSGMTNAYVCGVGANIGTASEGALKFGETISIPTGVYEIEEYIHGPNIQMTPRYSVFLIDGGEGSQRIQQIFEATKIVTPNVYLITNDSSYIDDNVFCVPSDLPEEMTPLCFLPFFQTIAYRITEELNRWDKHPLQRKMEKACSSKSQNYINSPFSEDTPGRRR
ncbi:MAG: SIS domain-containing protein [Lachnospiraceae bacterium]|nr:SIS domain-containing protein [Lachnospiraceae bacterium]